MFTAYTDAANLQVTLFLVYYVSVMLLITPRMLFGWQYRRWYRKQTFDLGYKPNGVTALVTITDETVELAEKCLADLKTSLEGCGIPFDIFVVVDDAGPGFTSTKERLRVRIRSICPHADVVFIGNACSKRANLVTMFMRARKMKRLHEITFFMDGDTILGDQSVAKNLLKHFANPRIGGVTTAQRILDPKTLSERISDWLEHARILGGMAAASLFGQVGCLPGRLYAVRTSILADRMSELDNDWWFIPARGEYIQCKAGDDRVISTWVLQAGYQSLMALDALVYTDAPDTLYGLTKMWRRWATSSQGYTIQAMTKSWFWSKRYWFVAYHYLSDIYVTVSTVIVVTSLPISFFYGDRQTALWLAIIYALTGMTLRIALLQALHLYSTKWRDLRILLWFIVMINVGQFIRFRALFQPSRVGTWGTRAGLDNERTAPVMYRRLKPPPRWLLNES